MIHYSVSDGVAVLRLDAPPVNALDFEVLQDLRKLIERAAADPDVRAVVITGRPDHFSAGADVGMFRELDSRQEAVDGSKVFQETFGEVEDCPKPVVAAVAGRTMGGALELAMACHFRLAAEGSRFAMPEVHLGIVPGCGGTQRLPRLVGTEAALGMLLKGEPVDAEKAQGFGLIDEICPAKELDDRARRLALEVPGPRKTREQTGKLEDDAANRAALQAAEERVGKVRSELGAPRGILEAVRVGLEESFEAGLKQEREGGGDCMQSPATKNKVYLFFATRETSKLPELADVKPAKVAQAGLVGMGSMGAGIAQAMMIAGVPVVVRGRRESTMEKATAKIRGSFERRVKQGKLAPQRAESMMGLLRTTTSWEELSEADFVIESVFEDVELKREVLQRLESVCRPGTILATNSSTISLDVLAEKMQRPERLVGMHFFNPAHRMPLVEVIRHEGTAPEVLATTLSLARRLRKTPVVVKGRAGFLVNRMFGAYQQEAAMVLEEGARPEAIDTALLEFGFPMGPLALGDMAGMDIGVHAHGVLAEAFPRMGPQAEIIHRLYDAGHLGQKASSGFYRYEPGSFRPLPSEACGEILAKLRQGRELTPRDFDAEEIVERLVLRMVTEASYLLDEGIARCQSDLDSATVLGIGFPDFRGGVVKYAQDVGLEKVLERLEQFTQECGERYAPCRRLEQMRPEG